MKTTPFVFVIIGLLVGCQSRQTTENQSTTETDSASESALAAPQCYQFVSSQDTIRLTMTRIGKSVTGDLTYQLSGKDRNTGTLSGQMRGDTLRADYTFQSEGTESVREVVFLRQNDQWLEGYGAVEERAGKTVFTPGSQLTFDGTMALITADCP